ncbi:MAG: RecX family transcriptional regulator [Elusimicrobiota bacterium]|jgi:regulatory protein|nr:RecX family transcriptional regulator [Elusimicrobiota bacterium]
MPKEPLNALQFSIKLLAKQTLSEKKLSLKLYNKGYAQSEILETIQTLKNRGFVDDKKFAQNLAQNLLSKFKGQDFILRKLNENAIEQNIIDQILKDIKIQELPERKIVNAFKAKFKNIDINDRKAVLRCANFFMRNGFLQDDIEKAFLSLGIEL